MIVYRQPFYGIRYFCSVSFDLNIKFRHHLLTFSLNYCHPSRHEDTNRRCGVQCARLRLLEHVGYKGTTQYPVFKLFPASFANNIPQECHKKSPLVTFLGYIITNNNFIFWGTTNFLHWFVPHPQNGSAAPASYCIRLCTVFRMFFRYHKVSWIARLSRNNFVYLLLTWQQMKLYTWIYS